MSRLVRVAVHVSDGLFSATQVTSGAVLGFAYVQVPATGQPPTVT